MRHLATITESIEAWKSFFLTVKLAALGESLDTIIISLISLPNSHHDAINTILRYLIIRNGTALGEHLGVLFFSNVAEDIKLHVNPFVNEKNSSFEEKLEMSLHYIKINDMEPRICSLNHLTKMLGSNRLKLNELIITQSKTH